MINYESTCQQALHVCKEVGAFIQQEALKFNSEAIQTKSLNQLVSYVDIEAEKKLVEGLGALLPQAGFVTEEETVASDAKPLCWIIDPLDGTTNFMHSIPVYSISVGLLEEDTLVMGIVYELGRDELFYAWKDGPALLNGKPIRVARATAMQDTLVATGFPYYDFEQMEAYLNFLKVLMKGTRGLRRMGSAAVDLAYVACGRFDSFFEYGLNAWDVAGGAFIVQQAGGKLSDFKGGNDYLFGKSIVAASSEIYPIFSRQLQQHFK